jgi:hypothetical protein
VTRTEERLTDALNARARAVREDSLPPLCESPVPRGTGQRPGYGRRPAWWLAPGAAAAAVLLIVGASMALSGAGSGSGRRQGPATASAPPRYVVQANMVGQVVVRSVATRAITATVPVPYLNSGVPANYRVAGAAHGEYFVVVDPPPEYSASRQIYRFTVTGSGHVTGFARVPGGNLGQNQNAYGLAAAPDGTRIAVAVWRHAHGLTSVSSIIVINTLTGARSRWRQPAGYEFTVENMSWTRNPARLVFLGVWCKGALQPGGESAAKQCVQQVREVAPAAAGGSVNSGRLLLREPGDTGLAQALISPDGATITAAVVAADLSLRVEQFSAATGKRLDVLYRRPSDGVPHVIVLRQDLAGQHWLLAGSTGCRGCQPEGGYFNGWISHGHLVPVGYADGRFVDEIW